MELFSGIFGSVSDDEEATTLLLAQRPELLDEKDSHGFTILHWVAKKGFRKITAQLLAQRPELANMTHSTPLHFAALEGHEALVTDLLAHTSRSVLVDPKWNPLDCALKRGHDTIVKKLLDHCPEMIETVTFENMSSLYIAIHRGHDKAVAQVLARRPKHVNNCTLHGAARQGHDKLIALLLDYNPLFADATNQDGSTALHEAARGGREKVIAQLLACSPKLIDVVNFRGDTALHYAVYSTNCKVLEQLLACKPELIDAVNAHGETPLQFALSSHYASPQAIAFLVAAKPEQALHRDREGNTPLHKAVDTFTARGTEIYIDQVWRPNPAAVRVANHEGLTPLHLAADNYYSNAIKCQCFWEFSVDEIASAFAMVGNPLEEARPAVDQHCESPLVGLLGEDVTSLVYLYLGFERKRNKRKCE